MSKTLLFVEDDPQDVQLTRLGFELAGFTPRLILAPDGEEALGLLRRLNPLPHAVLMDLKMPKMNGLELLRRIKEDARLRSLPTVFLTSSDYESDRKEAVALGATLYLLKPGDLNGYADVARQVAGLFSSAGG